VTDALADYAEANADQPAGRRIGVAITALLPFWTGRTIAGVHEASCRQYAQKRRVSNGTVRYELGVIRAAINLAVKANRLTRGAQIWLPDKPEPRDIWLTRSEVARLLRAARRTGAREHLPLFILLSGLEQPRGQDIDQIHVERELFMLLFSRPCRRRKSRDGRYFGAVRFVARTGAKELDAEIHHDTAPCVAQSIPPQQEA
jgi:integrase